MDAFYRNYLVKENHPIDDEVLERALESMEGAALKFSADAISDATQRENYNRNMKRVKAEVLAQVNAGKISVKEAAEFCYEARNKIMAETRKKTSVQGRAVAERKKLLPKELEKLINDKAFDKFGKGFGQLDSDQRGAIHYSIIESSARADARFNTANKVLGVAGKVLVLMTITYAVHNIINADNKEKEAIKQSATIAGGAAGSWFGASASIVCGPGAPICAIAFILAGGLVGGWLASGLVDSVDEELEEFTRWQVK